MKKHLLFTLLLVFIGVCGFSQSKKITVEEIWDNFSFYPRGVAGYTAMPVSDDYTVIKRAGIERHHFSDGSVAGIIGVEVLPNPTRGHAVVQSERAIRSLEVCDMSGEEYGHSTKTK